MFFLFTIVLFGFTFLRITVVAGDTESSRIAGLVGSILPSVLIAIFGYIAKKLLDQKTGDTKSDKVKISKPVDHNNSLAGKYTESKPNSSNASSQVNNSDNKQL